MRTLLLVSVALLALAVCGEPAYAEIRLPGVFSDHMVLQRDKPIRVWGFSAPGEEVRVQLAGHRRQVTADADGRWRVELPALPAGGPHKLIVEGTNKLRLRDVLIGDVWLCSGQSNMEWPVRACRDAKAEIAAARDTKIRHFKVPHRPSGSPETDVSAIWEVCGPDTAPQFTACGYFMARTLRRKLRVPIGLLNVSWGGTRIEPWIPRDGFGTVERLAEVGQRAQAAAGKKPGSHQEASVLYEGMLHPLVGFPLKGAIWYQGESNHRDGMRYTDLKQALIGSWRRHWDTGPFPFFFVQIAPFRYGKEAPEILPTFWEAQTAVLTRVPHTGMVVTNDIATLDNIHPPNKQDVGERLARLALSRAYGRKTVDSGPAYAGMQRVNGALRIRFEHAQGLKTHDGKPPSHFEIAGATTGFVPAKAKVVGDTILLSAENVSEPLAMRFAWHKLATPNLVNGAGLPAGAFRAGEIPGPDFLAQVDDARAYTLLYDLDLSKLGARPRYDVDERAAAGAFDRVAYLLELQSQGGIGQYVWVSMRAFSTDAKRLGIPTAASGTVFQQPVRDLLVRSNVPGVQVGAGLQGNLEFWSSNYGPMNQGNVEGASAKIWDFGDGPGGPALGYGCMQVHNTGAKQTLFAINRWRQGGTGADIGIGNSSLDPRATDWTFAANGASYTHKRLRAFVRTR